MATARGKWCLDDPDKPTQVHQKGFIRLWYTIHDHVTGKIERVRHGPSPVLTEEEELVG